MMIHKRITISLLFMVFAVLGGLSREALSQTNAAYGSEWQEGYTLIVTDNMDAAAADQARDYVVSRGGRIAILLSPHIMLGWIPPEIAPELIGKYGIEFISYKPIDPSQLKYRDEATLSGVSFFNAVVSGVLARESEKAQINQNHLVDDAISTQGLNYNDYKKNVERVGVEAAPGNSDSMTGTVAVALFFVESNGSIDANSYTWNSTDQSNTYNRAMSGLSWWSNKASAHGKSVTFKPFMYASNNPATQQGYEPITHSENEDGLWIERIMANLGFSSGDKMARVTAFNTWLRNHASTDWAYSAFIAYNPAPASGTFAGSKYSAYAHLGGPYTQLLFRNFGNEQDFGNVFSHEAGHIFWACDEYYEAGYGGCTSCSACADWGPRPTAPNGNCQYCNANAVSCRMRSSGADELCNFTVEQIGWGASSGCASGLTTLRNREGGPPIHPPGSLIKIASDQTVYLIDSDNRKRPLTSSSVLAQLYNQSTDARSSTNFSSWVITVTQDELDLYELGGNLSAALSGNGKPFPDGKLISYNGEVSIVTGGGKRRPFGASNTFTGLGFNFCQVVNVSQTEYNSYPQGPPVDAMPLLTASLNLSPAGPYTVGQNITGSFTIKNVGYQSITFTNLGVGGRVNGSTIYDMNFVSATLAAGASYTYSSQSRQLTASGPYSFFAAYQESNDHWAVSVPAAPGIIRSRQITVSTSTPPSAPTANSATAVTAGGFTANWSSSTGATGYRLDVSTSSSFTSFVSGYQDLDVGNVLSRSVTGLNSGTPYYYRVRAYNSSGVSSNSSTISVTTSAQSYTIALSSSPTGAGTVSGDGTFTAGSSRTVTATANSGYTFSNWTENGSVVSSSASYTFTLNNSRTLVANFTANTVNYTISLSASPSFGGTVGGDGTYAAGSTRTVTATASSGYTFANWTENNSVVSSSSSYTFTLNSSRTLVANFTSTSVIYDSVLKAPKCGQPDSVCDSATLLNGRGNLSGGQELNQPNTIYNSCADNSDGTYHVDESVDRLKVSTLDGSSFSPGKTVKIEATVWVWSGVSKDYLDLFYAPDATNPNWTHIGRLQPTGSGLQVLSTTYTLPTGGNLQAIRANFGYDGAVLPCGGGSSFDDHDDLVFAVTPNVQVTIQTIPSGRSFTVDNNTYTTPQTFSWTPGTSHSISTTATQGGGVGTQYVWNAWSDGGAISHNVIAPTSSTTYTANFNTQYFLTMNAGSGGSVSPSSNWYTSGQSVTITASPNGGFSFGDWAGSGNGSYTGGNNPSTVTMNSPVTETASFTSIPLRLDSVSPVAGRASGGQQIRLAGSFPNLSTVRMGGVSASWSYTNGTSEIAVTTPANAVGAVSIELVQTNGNTNSKSNAFVYLPTIFTDNTLVAGVTTAKMSHITELRQAIDALRAVAGLQPAPWTEVGLVPFVTIIRVVHIQELRTYLNDVMTRLGYQIQPYTDPSLTTLYIIKRVYIEELRQRIRAIAG